jgi:hypothetical protein
MQFVPHHCRYIFTIELNLAQTCLSYEAIAFHNLDKGSRYESDVRMRFPILLYLKCRIIVSGICNYESVILTSYSVIKHLPILHLRDSFISIGEYGSECIFTSEAFQTKSV